MGTRRLALWIALLVPLFAAAASASSSIAGVTPGDVQLDLSPDFAVALPIDAQGLTEDRCRNRSYGGNVPKCLMSVEQGGSVHILVSPGEKVLQWQPRLTAFPSGPVESSCGTWDVSLGLDGTEAQPVSPLLLTADPEDLGRGAFDGSLEMKAILHIANRTTGETVDYPLSLGFELSGPWALTDPDPSDAPGGGSPGISNLDLLSDGENVCIAPWVVTNDPELAKQIATNCRMCLRKVAHYPSHPL
jgi:hypothetical protein